MEVYISILIIRHIPNKFNLVGSCGDTHESTHALPCNENSLLSAILFAFCSLPTASAQKPGIRKIILPGQLPFAEFDYWPVPHLNGRTLETSSPTTNGAPRPSPLPRQLLVKTRLTGPLCHFCLQRQMGVNSIGSRWATG